MSVGKFRQRHMASGPLQASRHNLLIVRSKDGYLTRSGSVASVRQENANEYEIDQREHVDIDWQDLQPHVVPIVKEGSGIETRLFEVRPQSSSIIK